MMEQKSDKVIGYNWDPEKQAMNVISFVSIEAEMDKQVFVFIHYVSPDREKSTYFVE